MPATLNGRSQACTEAFSGTLDLLAARTVSNKLLFFIHSPVLGMHCTNELRPGWLWDTVQIRKRLPHRQDGTKLGSHRNLAIVLIPDISTAERERG